MLRKGDIVRKYIDSSETEFREYEIIQGGKADLGCLIYVKHIKSSRPEWFNIFDVVKVIN